MKGTTLRRAFTTCFIPKLTHKVTQKSHFQCQFDKVVGMNAYPFSVFKRSNRTYYSVSFKDNNGKFLSPVSTGKKTEAEAMQIAFKWLRDGIPQKQAALKVRDMSLKDVARKLKTKTEAETLLKELKRMGWIKSYVLSESPAAQDFTSFLSDFWNWDKSAYIAEKRRKNHGIHRSHCIRQGQATALYWYPFFRGRILGDITATDIDAFINHMGEKPLSAGWKNSVVLAGTKPLRWAFSKGMIETDPTRGHILFSGEERKKLILSPTAAAAIFRIKWKDERVKLANMLAAVTGMRQGEILALRLQDVGPDCLYVRGSWNRNDGLKLPKNNEPRTVELPFPYLTKKLIELGKNNPWGVSADSFIFWTENKCGVPMQGRLFVEGLRAALIKSDFSADESGKYLFHGWRHFYTAYMRDRIHEKLLQFQTGHKTLAMLEHYSDHQKAGDREQVQAAQRAVFGELIPSGVNYIKEAAECG